LRAGSSVADAGKAAIRPTTGIKASHRMILLREKGRGREDSLRNIIPP
jgi:hypothetical protein